MSIDLSGAGGLAPKFWGDSDETTTKPQTRYFSEDSAMAEGYFNPWRRNGYLSPSTSGIDPLTLGNALAAVPSSVVYDDINDDIYFAESGKQLYRLDGLDDTSATRVESALLGGSFGSPQYTDLEIYQKYGVRYLFGIYSRTADSFTADAGTDYITFGNSLAVNGAAITVSTSGGLPGGLAVNTTYYLVNSAGYTAQLSTSLGGAAVNITSSGSGIHTATGSLGNMYGLNLVDGTTNHAGVLARATNPLQLVGARPLLRVADNGYMYILDGYAVHKFDGTVAGGEYGTVTANVLLFPSYFNITDGIDYRGLMFMAVHQSTISAVSANIDFRNFSTQCGIYVWDRQSTTVQTRDYIPVVGVRAIRKIYISPDGALRIMCIAANGLTQVREYTGSTFSVILELGQGASPQYPDSLTVSTSHTMWLGNDGTIYGHGKINPSDKEILAKLGYIKAPSTNRSTNLTGAGFVFYGGSNFFSSTYGYRTDRQALLIGYNDNGTYGLSKFYPFDGGTINSVVQYALQGDVYTKVFFLPPLSTLHYIYVYFSPCSNTDPVAPAIYIDVYINNGTTPIKSYTVTDLLGTRGYARLEINKPYVNNFQIKFRFPTGNVINGGSDVYPYLGVVGYEQTTTKG